MGVGRSLLIGSVGLVALFLVVVVIGSVMRGPETRNYFRSETDEAAELAIRDGGHPCGTVTSSTRLSGGGIRAVCSNGEVYRVSVMGGHLVAMRCSAAVRLGITGC